MAFDFNSPNAYCNPEAYEDAVMKDVVIVTRDCNGKTQRYEFPTGGMAGSFIADQMEEDPDNENELIVFVAHDGCCVYTDLDGCTRIGWEDLDRYFDCC